MNYYDQFSTLPIEEKLRRAKEMRDEAWYANLAWLEAAEVAHKFKAGDQWSDDEKFKLQMQGRTPLVWNYIHPAVELTIGVLSQNPVRIYPYPTEKGDDFLCEVLEDIVTYLDANQLDADDEHDTMFENCIVTGIGDVVVDVGPDPDNPEEIFLYEQALDAYEVLIDPMYKKGNLTDARYVAYEKWVTAEDFKVRYPKQIKDMEEIFTEGITGLSSAIQRESNYTSNTASTTTLFEYYDSQNKRILVTHLEIREAYKRSYYKDEQGKTVEISKEEKKEAKAQPGSIIEVYDTKVYVMHYIHDRILWEGESPVYKKNFSLCRMRAYIDKSARMHSTYGLVKNMLDPQRECNKRWMHTLKLLNSQGVGVMAEVDAFHDLPQAQDSWNDPDQITFMAKGGLNKVKEKAVPVFPDATMKLEEMNKDAMKHISGINPDLMGMAQQRREPGINLKLRQKQGLTMLSKLFSNYKRARKEIYKRKLEIIVRYMPDAQIQKILGETANYTFKDGHIIDQKRGLVAPIRKIRDLGYNVRMEDAPGGMNKMMAELATFMEMMEKGFPVDPNTVIDKLDLSPIEKANWKMYIESSQKAKAEVQQVEIKLKQDKLAQDGQLKAAAIDVENKKIEATNELGIHKLKFGQEENMLKLGATTDIEEGKLQQNYKISQMELTLKIAEMKESERRDMVEILKFVAQQQNAKPAANASGANVNPNG